MYLVTSKGWKLVLFILLGGWKISLCFYSVCQLPLHSTGCLRMRKPEQSDVKENLF